MPPFKYEFSSSLKAELDRLKNGTSSERQRYRNVQTAIAKVISNPLNPEFDKKLPDGYEAVDVLQQYRLFFKIYNSRTGERFVFFVWMNDEASLHETGKATDCYNVFRRKLVAKEIPVYEEPTPKSAPEFILFGKWGDTFLNAFLRVENEKANSNLTLSQIGEHEYRIQVITVSKNDVRLATQLMTNLCAEADRYRITLHHELVMFQNPTALEKSLRILKRAGFSLEGGDTEIQLWVRRPASQKK